MSFLKPENISVFMGYYGSGKTEVALNYALFLKKSRERVAIADFDFVNPFFRTADAVETLKKNGIEPIVLNFANTNVEMVTLNPAIYGYLSDENTYIVIDVGGDDAGATALGGLYPHLRGKKMDVFYVASAYRPFNETAGEVLKNIREIESASRLRVTGVINNSNLALETTEEGILATKDYAKEIEALSKIPVVATTVREDLVTERLKNEFQNIFPVRINIEYIWNRNESGGEV